MCFSGTCISPAITFNRGKLAKGYILTFHDNNPILILIAEEASAKLCIFVCSVRSQFLQLLAGIIKLLMFSSEPYKSPSSFSPKTPENFLSVCQRDDKTGINRSFREEIELHSGGVNSLFPGTSSAAAAANPSKWERNAT